jgi:alanyl-tRNA synthetase
MPLSEAKAMGAMALFGEKYGDIVRVVGIGDYSLELCGGCHVRNTREIGLFKIVSESGIGSGVRRIEALTGRHAFRYMEEGLNVLAESAALLKTQPAELPRRIEGLLGEMRELAREKESLAARLSKREADSLTERVQSVDGINVLVARVEAGGMEALRNMADGIKAKLGSVALLLGSVHEGKVQLIAAVTPDLVERGYHAGQLIKRVAAVCGGGGGGRPDMAQAGGKDPGKLEEALQLGERILTAKETLD